MVAAGSKPEPIIPPEIDALYAAWRDAFRRGDVPAALALLTPDYTLWQGGQVPLSVDGIRPALEGAFAIYAIDSTFERIEFFISGPLAVDCGWDVQALRPRSGGPTQTMRQRVIVILTRGDDGRWRFSRGFAQRGPEA